jgi:hypothetical protein
MYCMKEWQIEFRFAIFFQLQQLEAQPEDVFFRGLNFCTKK